MGHEEYPIPEVLCRLRSAAQLAEAMARFGREEGQRADYSGVDFSKTLFGYLASIIT